MSTPNHFILTRPFIESAVARCVDRTAYSNTDLHHACARLALYVETETDLELTDSAVFAAPTIEEYIPTLTDMSPASRGNLRSMLYRMSEVLLGTTRKGDMSCALSASSPSEPYSTVEASQLIEWFAAQGDRQTDAAALLGLGFGAGLSSGEIVAVKPSDIVVENIFEGALVYVNVRGARARRILVDDAYSKFVLAAWEAHRKAKWLFAPNRDGADKNLISNFVARGPDVGWRPQTQRMRATYLVKHIREGDSVMELLRIAGWQRRMRWHDTFASWAEMSVTYREAIRPTPRKAAMTTDIERSLSSERANALEAFTASCFQYQPAFSNYKRADVIRGVRQLALWSAVQPEVTLDAATVFSAFAIDSAARAGFLEWSPTPRRDIRTMLIRYGEALKAVMTARR